MIDFIALIILFFVTMPIWVPIVIFVVFSIIGNMPQKKTRNVVHKQHNLPNNNRRITTHQNVPISSNKNNSSAGLYKNEQEERFISEENI